MNKASDPRSALTAIVAEIVKNDQKGAAFTDAPEDRLGTAARLVQLFQQELEVDVPEMDLALASNNSDLVDLIEPLLPRARSGPTLVDIFVAIKRITLEEVAHPVDFRWYSHWNGDIFVASDSLDDVEVIV